jgi:hypothetical protein
VTRMPKKPPTALRRKPAAPIASGTHSCLQCPACGTEACRTLQELGMYCDTLTAVSEAVRLEKRPGASPVVWLSAPISPERA